MKNRTVDKQLGQILKELKIITEEQLDKALKLQCNGSKGALCGKILQELGFISENDIAQALNVQYRFPYLPISAYDIPDEVMSLIPEELMRQYNVVPVDRTGNVLSIAMENPLQEHVIRKISMLSGSKVQVILTTCSEISKTIDKFFNAGYFPTLPHERF